jgi:Spy/CpxP family protein refolding chaperone
MRNYSFLIIIVLIFFPGILSAQPDHTPGFGFGRQLMQQLNLSPEQVNDLTCETPGQGRKLKDEMHTERTRLNAMIRDKAVADADIQNQLEIVNDLQASLNRHRLKKMLQARQILTADQLNKLLELKQEFGYNHHRSQKQSGQ